MVKKDIKIMITPRQYDLSTIHELMEGLNKRSLLVTDCIGSIRC